MRLARDRVTRALRAAAGWSFVAASLALCLALSASGPAPPALSSRTFGALLGTATVGPDGGSVPFPGGVVSIPAGALPGPTTVRVSTAPAPPTTPLNAYARYLGPAIRVDLSGVRPRVAVRVQLRLEPSAVAGTPPAAVLAATASDPAQPYLLLTSQYDPATHDLMADAIDAGVFTASIVDLERFSAKFGELVFNQLLGIGTARPACAGQQVTLSDRSVVSIAPASWQQGDNPALYACVVEKDDRYVVVRVANNRPDSYSFNVPATYTVGQLGLPTSKILVQKIMYDLASRVRGTSAHPLTSGSTIAIDVPVAQLPARITVRPDEVLAWMGAVAGALPLLLRMVAYVVRVWGPIGLTVATAIDALLDATEVYDCIVNGLNPLLSAGTDGPPPLTAVAPTAFNLLIDCMEDQLTATLAQFGLGGIPKPLKALRGFAPPVAGIVTTLTATVIAIDVVRTPAPTGSGSPEPTDPARDGGGLAQPPTNPPGGGPPGGGPPGGGPPGGGPALHPGTGLDVSSGPPGTVVTASGDRFHPNQPITVSQSGPGGTGTVGTVTADGTGAFEMTFRVGDGTPEGRITLTFRQAPDIRVTDTFYVTACNGCPVKP